MKRDTAGSLLLSVIAAGLCLVLPGYLPLTTSVAAQPSTAQPAVAEASDFVPTLRGVGTTSDKMTGKPSIEIHPEFFLGWTQPEPAPPPPKRLPWPLKITLTAVNASNEVIAGPMSVTTTEELVGSRFRKASVIPSATAPANSPSPASTPIPASGGASPITGGTTTASHGVASEQSRVSSIRPTTAFHGATSEQSRVSADKTAPSIKPAFTTSPSSAIQLQELEFASLVDTRGAGFMNLKCFVRLTLAENGHAEQVQTLTTVECRPDRETTLATFGGLSLKILVAWNDTTE